MNKFVVPNSRGSINLSLRFRVSRRRGIMGCLLFHIPTTSIYRIIDWRLNSPLHYGSTADSKTNSTRISTTFSPMVWLSQQPTWLDIRNQSNPTLLIMQAISFIVNAGGRLLSRYGLNSPLCFQCMSATYIPFYLFFMVVITAKIIK